MGRRLSGYNLTENKVRIVLVMGAMSFYSTFEFMFWLLC